MEHEIPIGRVAGAYHKSLWRRFMMPVLGVAVILSACTRPVASLDRDQALVQMLTAMRAKTYDAIAAIVPCSRHFEIESGSISDITVEGDHATVEASVSIRPFEDLGPTYDTSGCYGSPSRGWKAGVVSTGRYHARFTRWESGWRISSTPEVAN